MKEMEVKRSELIAGDTIFVKGKFLRFPFNLIIRLLARGFKHVFMYYGKNERGEGLTLDITSRHGPTISLLRKYVGQEVEVYRINHRYSKVFLNAVLKAGEAILLKKYAFYDWPLILWKILIVKLGLPLRIKSKYYPFYFCSELLQIYSEDAVNYLDGKALELYKKDILSYLPRRLMTKDEFCNLPFMKKVGEGKVV